MSYFKLKQLLKKKGILLTFLIASSLLICEKTLAEWNQKHCQVFLNPDETQIRIEVKFFEYSKDPAKKNSFLSELKAFYSTDGGFNYEFLIKTMCNDQAHKTWAWIALQLKNQGELIDLYYPINKGEWKTTQWKDKEYPILRVNNHSIFKNETRIYINWFLRKDQRKISHIKIEGKWMENGISADNISIFVYPLTPKKAKLNSNSLKFSNSSAKQEVSNEAKIKTVKAYKQSNSIVVKGAHSETIQVYTTTGKLVKSIVADRDIEKIELSAKQVYVVNIGQQSYKIAL